MDNETRSLPMVALRGLTIMPEMIVHFDVSRERSIAAIQQAMVEEQEIFLVAQKSIETENPGQDDVYETGTVASVKQLIKLSKKVVRVLVEGKNRAVLKKIEETDPYLPVVPNAPIPRSSHDSKVKSGIRTGMITSCPTLSPSLISYSLLPTLEMIA